jgi:hypothetical protein
MQQRMMKTQMALEGKTNNKIETETKKVVQKTEEMEVRLVKDAEKNKKKLSK